MLIPGFLFDEHYETARVHHACQRRGGSLAARGARAAAGNARDRIAERLLAWRHSACYSGPKPWAWGQRLR